MKIIISGTVDLDPEQMDAAMVAAKPLIEGALTQDGILDYDWCPDKDLYLLEQTNKPSALTV